jgi:hypothetical protein
MARCIGCGINGKNNRPLCWAKYQMCLQCCVKKYPHEYPSNVVLKALSSQAIKRSDRLIRICQVCNSNIKKLAFHAGGKRIALDAGYCTVCARITVYDPRLKVQEVVS